MDDSSVPHAQPRRRRWPAILLVVVIVLAAAFALVWFVPAPSVPEGPVQLARGEDGRMAPVDPEAKPSNFSFEIHAGKIKAANNFTSTAVASSSDHAGFACSRLAIFNRSDHPLMARIGQSLLEELKPVAFLRRIDYYPAGFSAKQGELAPDIVVMLDLAEMTESGLPLSRTLKARFTVAAGNGLPGCRNHYTDSLTPPCIRFEWNGELDHVSTTTGVNSSAAKYKLVAENVAKQIADLLTKEFSQRLEKEGPLPELPQAFYPPYRPAPSLPLAEFGIPRILTSWHGLMNHDETLWHLGIDRPAAETLDAMRQRLEADGWKKMDLSRNYLRMARKGAVLIAYGPSQEDVSRDVSPKESFLHVQYVDRMTREEVRAAMDQALAANVSPDVLIRFERPCSKEQSRRILELFRARSARTPQASLSLAKLYHRLKQDDDAREELLRARALLWTIARQGDLQNKARNLAKELGDEKLAEKPVEPKVFEELGFTELKAGETVLAREIGVEEPVYFYAKNSDGELKTVSLRVIKAEAYQLAFVDSSERGRSWGTSGTTHSFYFGDQCLAIFSLEQTATGGRFRLNTQVSDQ